MNKNDKELLLKDLCARLPYEVMGSEIYENKLWGMPELLIDIDMERGKVNCSDSLPYRIENFRPYLRPMSSMTEKERKEVEILIKENRPSPYGVINNKGIDNLLFSVSVTSGVLTDWLNSHHFNYRGLIEKGLALEAPEDMYK